MLFLVGIITHQMSLIKESILTLGKGPTQGLDDTSITTRVKHSINFTVSKINFVLNLHYSGSKSSFCRLMV